MRSVTKIVLASQSRHKLEEFRALLQTYASVELVPASDLLRNAAKLSKVELGSSYLENASAKARHVNWACHYPALGDDTGLEVDLLNGRPGVLSHRYATPTRNESQDQANIKKLLREIEKAAPKDAVSTDYSARFVTSLCLCIEGVMIHSTAVLEGTIIDAPRGTNGFGYDSIFVPRGQNKTLAEMTMAEKNAFSHRAKAVQDLFAQTGSLGITLIKP